MAPVSSNKRKVENGMRGKVERPKKRIRKQKVYHSSSEDSDQLSEDDHVTVDSALSEEDQQAGNRVGEGAVSRLDPSTSEASGDSGEDSLGDESAHEGDGNTTRPKQPPSKRNDPDAFSTTISKILSTKLSQGARKDPVLSRSREATNTSKDIANERLERRAKAKLRAERKEDLERSRVKDVLGLESGKAGEVADVEKQLGKIAQRGVVKLFNAVRAAQVKGEEAAREARKKGTVGYTNREERVNEMSKQGFLDLINGSKGIRQIEEAR